MHLVLKMCLWDLFYFISWSEKGIKLLPVKHTLHSKRKHMWISFLLPHRLQNGQYIWQIKNTDQLKQYQVHFISVNMQNNQSLWKRTFLEVWHKHRIYPFVKWQMINWLRFLQFNRYFIVHLFFSSDLLCSFWSCNTERGALVNSYWVECQQLLQFNLKVSEELIYHLFWLASLYHLLLIGPKR